MHKYPMPVSNLRNLRDRLQRSGLVIRMHDRDKSGSFINGRCNCFGTDTTTFIDRQIGDAKRMQPLESTTGIEYSRMLCYLDDDMVPFMTIGKSHTTNSKIITLCP